MGHHCHDHHCHEHHHEESCGSGGHSCQCKGSCGCCGSSTHQGEWSDFGSQLIELADLAWMEVLKEKIKEQVETSSGKHLDKLAKLVAEANKVRWQHKMAKEKTIRDYKGKVAEFFNKE